MSKIYNEIVIDMNPESPDFEKVIYEDSFEHSGNIMLAQAGAGTHEGEKATVGTSPKKSIYYDPQGKEMDFMDYMMESRDNYGNKKEGYRQENLYAVIEFKNNEWVAINETSKKSGADSAEGAIKHYNALADAPSYVSGMEEDWGAADISADDFIYEEGHPKAGQQRPLFEVAQRLDPKLPGKTGDELMDQIRDMAPKYQSIAKKATEQKGFAKEAREKDVYGLSKEARKVGAKARSAYGGMGAGMRGAAEAGADIGRGFKEAQQAHRKDIYGIEQKAAGEYEGAISKFIDADWLATPDTGALTTDWSEYEEQYQAEQIPPRQLWEELKGREGGYVHKDRSGIGNNRRKTFLDLMISLPDAGGS